MLQEILILKESHLQSTEECECRYLLTTVGDLGEMVLEEVYVGLKVISRPYFYGEKVVTTPLGFLASGILCKECLCDL